MITLYSHNFGPNGWKVVIILEALGIKYETKYLDFASGEHKAPEHTKYNPNGRIPTIIDHDNNDFVLWESNAIVKYLVDRYDKNHKFHFAAGTSESYFIDQWMTFQVSGQGPYFGQAGHFAFFHDTKLPTAIERYQKEIIRVISVLDGVLADKEYLVGNKLTIADLVFVPWDVIALGMLLKGNPFEEESKQYKNFLRWHERVLEYPFVKKAIEEREKRLAAGK